MYFRRLSRAVRRRCGSPLLANRQTIRPSQQNFLFHVSVIDKFPITAKRSSFPDMPAPMTGGGLLIADALEEVTNGSKLSYTDALIYTGV